MNELKPCPFCGTSPQCGVERYESGIDGIKLAAIIICPHCYISQKVIFKATDNVSLVPFYKFENAFIEAIKRWNSRVGEREDE